MTFFKDVPALKTAAVVPAKPVSLPAGDALLRAIAKSYNSVGGLIERLASEVNIEPMAVLAVWQVESGTLPYVPGKPVLRFENHKFWKFWGQSNAAAFDAHFQFGGHAGIPGGSAKNHKFRESATSVWRTFHGSQAGEYEVFDFAVGLGGKEAACLSASFGGPQIMGFNHNACGYSTGAALFDAFGSDIRWQVLGFFDFVESNNLTRLIRAKKWTDFGQSYNGDGAVYGPKLAAAFAKKAAFDALPRP